MAPRLADGVLESIGRQWILAADVQESLLGAAREARDREGLDHREGILLHHDPVLERPRLRFVGVADHVVGPDRLRRDRLPLHAGRERGPSAPEELRVADGLDHVLGPHLDRGAERLVAAVGAVVVDRRGIDDSRPAEEAQTIAPLGRARLRRPDAAGAHHRGIRRDHRVDGRPGGVAERHLGPSRALREDGRRLLAHPETRRSDPGPTAGVRTFGSRFARQFLAEGEPARPSARQVVTDVHDVRGSLLDAEHRVEGRHAVGVGRGNGEPLRDVVETAPADPAHAALERMQGRQQEVALVARLTASAHDPKVARGPLLTPLPAGLRWPQESVHRRPLRLRRGGVHQMEVHATSVIRGLLRRRTPASAPARRSP